MSLLDVAQSSFLRFHMRVYTATGGRIGHRMIGVPTLLLRSTGRKTGQIRSAALVYAMDGASYVVVASNGGSDIAPGWLANVRENADVGLQVATKTESAVAAIIEKGAPDYDRLWKLVNENNHHRYDAYQQKTSRPIALVRLTP
jgi:F420H(2)-dependent quinone reductase